jgi:hypothetical protein
MFKPSSVPSADWTALEFDRYKDYMGDNWLPPPAPGHNGPPGKLPWTVPVVTELTAEEATQARRERFDQLARENLRGLYLAQLKCLLRATDDPRVTKAHGQVLAKIIERTDGLTGMSYPGRDWMAAHIIYYDDNFQPQHYEPQTISNLIADLRRWGYHEQDQRGRGIDGKRRAVAHYVTLTPELTYLQEQIAAWCLELRDKPKRQRPKPDLLTGEYARNSACLTDGQGTQNETCLTDGKVTQEAGLLGEHRSNPSGLLCEHPNSPRETRKHAGYLEDYNLEEERGADARDHVNEAIADATNRSTLLDRSSLPDRATLTAEPALQKACASPKGAAIDLQFEEFWKAFPSGRKQGKGDALDLFRQIVTGKHKKRPRTSAAILIDAVKRYAATKPDPKYTPMPTTWLNGGRWMDDLSDQPKPGSKYDAY